MMTDPSFGSAPRQDALDPLTRPELFEGVLLRRMMAFIVDFFVITVPIVIFILLFGLVTFGIGWFLFLFLSPIVAVWALLYYGFTLGGRFSATVGMRLMDIEMRTWYGAPSYFLLGAVHAILFWLTVSFLTPLVLLVGLINPRRRLLHDILIGTVVINNLARAAALRPV